MAIYENYGDANFFEGGCFIMDAGDGDYEVITCDFVNDADEDTYLFCAGIICPEDSWIDVDAVRACCGNENAEGAELVREIVSCYGLEQANGDCKMLSSAEVIEQMNGYAAEYDFDSDTWSAGPLY